MTEQEYLELVALVMSQETFDAKTYTDRCIKRVADTYTRAYKELFSLVMSELSGQFNASASPNESDVYALLAQIESRLAELDSLALASVKKELEAVYLASAINYKKVVKEISSLNEMLTYAPFSAINTYQIERLISETAEDLLFATKHVNKEMKKTIRSIFSKHLQLQSLRGSDYKDVVKAIEKDLTAKAFRDLLKRKGFSSIIDSAGRRWNLHAYVTLVVKTKMSDAYHEALQEEALQEEFDLAIISENSATDHCRHFEGMVISLNGRAKGFLTYQQLKATGYIFHPNCRHTCYPLGSFDTLHDDVKASHYAKMKQAREFLKSR